MTAALDQSATPNAVSASSVVLTWPTLPTAGSKVIVKVILSGDTAISAVDNGVTPTTLTADVADSAFGAFVWAYTFRGDAITLPGSGSYHVTITFNSSVPAVAFGDTWLGLAAGGPTGSNSDAGTGTTADTGAVTPAVTGALVTAVLATDSGNNPETITLTSAGWTDRAQLTNGTIAAGASADIIVSGTSAQTATWSIPDGPNWMGVIAVYSPAPAAGPAFPESPLDLTAEIDVGGWTDVSTLAYQREGSSPPVSFSRGRPDESPQATPVSGTWQLNNRSGNFSPKNPLGTWYGLLGRNTPARWSVPAIGAYLRLEDMASAAACGAASGLDITGDTDIRIDLTASGCGPYGTMLAAKGSSTHVSWVLSLNADLTPSLLWSADGTSLAGLASGRLPVPARGRYALKATLATSTGTVTFYTSDSMGGSWTQLGPSASGTGGASTSVYSGSATLPVAVGLVTGKPAALLFASLPQFGICGRIWEFQLLSGIGGTLKADPVFSAQAAGTTSFADAQGNTWAVAGTAEISDRDYRFHAELSSLPPKWDSTGRDQWVDVTAGGLLRRLQQGDAPLLSPMARYYTVPGAPACAAFWPMEDAQGSTQLGAAVGQLPMYFSGSPTLASSSIFAGSSPIPVSNGAAFSATVTYSGSWTDNDVRWLMMIPAGETDGAIVAVVAMTGAVAQLTVTYNTASSGSLTLKGYDATGALLFTGTTQTGVNGKAYAVQVAAQASGTNMLLNLMVAGTPSASGSVNVSAGTVGAVRRVTLNPNGGLTGTVFGQLAVLPVLTSLLNLQLYNAAPGAPFTGPITAWQYEPAGVRAGRLVLEQGFQFRGTGNLAGTQAMGPQTAEDVVSLLGECEAADRGILTEPRTVLGIGYRARTSLYNQAVTVLDYSSAELGGTGTGLEPVYDDQYTRNDETVSRSGGSSSGASARFVLDDGSPMSTGVIGTYSSSDSLNVASDNQLMNLASFIVSGGTVDEARWPAVPLNLARPEVAALWWALLGLDLGDRFQITNLPDVITYDPADQLAFQLKESLGGFHYAMDWCGVPAKPYTVAVASGSKAMSGGSVLAAGAISTAPFLSVATTAPGASLWSTSAAPFDISLAGERITVTAVSGSSSPQTFSVTRSVNGVVKAQTLNTPVQLWTPSVAAL